MGLHKYSVTQLRNKLEQKQVTSKAIVASYIQQIEKSKNNAFITVTKDLALQMAAESDQRRQANKLLSPWDGIPIGIKDNINTEGIKTTCGSKMLNDYIAPYDATVVAKIKAAGLPILGKNNMDEFAMGSSSETSAFGQTLNPVDTTRVPGGSSGGSAAAVAGFEVPWSLGSDTGGSIRQPAAYCGIVGLKPTYGRVSRYGLVAYASSLDHIGPMATDVEGVAALLQIIAGHDVYDATSAQQPVVDYSKSLVADVHNLRLGIPKEYFTQLNDELKDAIMRTIGLLAQAGAIVKEISLPTTPYVMECCQLLACAEASSSLARYDGVRYGLRVSGTDSVEMFKNTRLAGFGAEVKRRIILGTHVLGADNYQKYYAQAQKVRSLVQQDFNKAFETVDVIVAPTTPSTAFEFGLKADPLEMYQSDVYTMAANLAGIPAMSLPCGLDGNKLPIGIQLMGQHFTEEILLRTGYTLQELGNKQVSPNE